METWDVIVVGAGIAGASAAYEIAADRRVLVLERESQPGYHSTGRSAAIYTESYGNRPIRALTTASRGFYGQPPKGFTDTALWSGRGVLMIGTEAQLPQVRALYDEVREFAQDVRLVDGDYFEAMVQVARPGVVAGGLLDTGAMELDVGAIHHGYLQGARQRGGELVTDAEVTGLSRQGGAWVLDTAAGRFAAPVLINAAGAWADTLAAMAGAAPAGLTPKRRTVCTFDAPPGIDVSQWHLVVDVDESFYFKPESGRILGSPADETPLPPCDAQPDEMDIAVAIDRIQSVIDVQVRHIRAKWAGLRTFAPDKTPVVGFDPSAEGFFWLAGQGGYGIQTAPAMGRTAAALSAGRDLPDDIRALGVAARDLAPGRAYPETEGD
ncbi:MAG: FAD-binding oxidoreductase [Hyphomicrobiales bacterium]|nr:FAD-binding oxidoreductase [Hyphomicrobiales bacterium]MCP5372319.1 FAD-binding oxidoreductase [Hyphomicrobiales bacterium]